MSAVEKAELLRETLDIDGIAKCKVDVGAGQGHVAGVLDGQGRIPAGRRGEDTVEDVSQPQRAAERLVAQELVGSVRCVMTIKDPIHLQEPGGLAEVDVGANSVSAAPFVNDDQAESLDVGEVGLVQIGVDQGDGLARKSVRRSGRSAAIATDEGRGAPTEGSISFQKSLGKRFEENPFIKHNWQSIPLRVPRDQPGYSRQGCLSGLVHGVRSAQ